MQLPENADRQVLAIMAARGIDLEKPTDLEFTVAAPDETSAYSIKEALGQAGYRCEAVFESCEMEDQKLSIGEEHSAPSWSVYVYVKMVPKYEEIIEVQQDIDRVARSHYGKSDGWQVALT